MKKVISSFLILMLGISIQSLAIAADHQQHGAHDHSMMGENANQIMGMGTLNQVDSEQKTVNLTHQPIPALNWPAMTMDLPVTKRVDLSGFKAGDKVHFTLKQGRDKQFRISTMEVAE